MTRPTRLPGARWQCPVTVVQQDWGAALGYDAAGLWRPWAPDLNHYTVDSGHFMAGEAPEHIKALLRQLIAR
jgi:haloacetate dehalogenase